MPTQTPPRPTGAELEILAVLWKRGPSTVSEVQEALDKSPAAGYTTVLKFLQIMLAKGLVERDEAKRTHVYAAGAPQEQTQRQLVGDLLDRAFAGSARNLVMQALSARKASAEELAEIRKLLKEFERGAK
jgi:predicted transcriptional regulator